MRLKSTTRGAWRASASIAATALLAAAAALAARGGVKVKAGHGLTYVNVKPVVAVREIEEVNIGHSIVSRALLVGFEKAVREMKGLMDAARRK